MYDGSAALQAMTFWAAESAAASSQVQAVPPEPLSRALAAVWGAQARVVDELEVLQGGLRELVQRRCVMQTDLCILQSFIWEIICSLIVWLSSVLHGLLANISRSLMSLLFAWVG